MATVPYPLSFGGREPLGKSLAASVALHALLFAVVAAYVLVNFHRRLPWGNAWTNGEAARISVVNRLPGIPLPTPMLETRNTVVTDNPGLYQQQPEPVSKPPEPAEEIPKFKEAVPPKPVIRVNKRIQHEPLETPPNAVPTGAGGNPALNYGQIVLPGAEGQITFGDLSFGDRYGWYVQAIRNRISNNWLTSMIGPAAQTAHRVYIDFDILKDGTVTNVRLTQSSGNPETDRSALRAIYASTPLAPLPADYGHNEVSVDFYFDPHLK